LLNTAAIAATADLGVGKSLVSPLSLFQTFPILFILFIYFHREVSARPIHIVNVGSIHCHTDSSTHIFQSLNHPTAYTSKRNCCLSISESHSILKTPGAGF